MEIAGFDSGEYDIININGDLDLLGIFNINLDFADGLDLDSLIGKSFDYLNITGEQTGIPFADWAINLVDGWAANWVDDGVDGWRLAVNYDGVADDNGQAPTDVPEPSTLLLMLLAISGLIRLRYK